MQTGPQEAGAAGAPLEMREGNAKDPNPLTHCIRVYQPLHHDSEVAVDPGMNTQEFVRTLLKQDSAAQDKQRGSLGSLRTGISPSSLLHASIDSPPTSPNNRDLEYFWAKGETHVRMLNDSRLEEDSDKEEANIRSKEHLRCETPVSHEDNATKSLLHDDPEVEAIMKKYLSDPVKGTY